MGLAQHKNFQRRRGQGTGGGRCQTGAVYACPSRVLLAPAGLFACRNTGRTHSVSLPSPAPLICCPTTHARGVAAGGGGQGEGGVKTKGRAGLVRQFQHGVEDGPHLCRHHQIRQIDAHGAGSLGGPVRQSGLGGCHVQVCRLDLPQGCLQPKPSATFDDLEWPVGVSNSIFNWKWASGKDPLSPGHSGVRAITACSAPVSALCGVYRRRRVCCTALNFVKVRVSSLRAPRTGRSRCPAAVTRPRRCREAVPCRPSRRRCSAMPAPATGGGPCCMCASCSGVTSASKGGASTSATFAVDGSDFLPQ